VEGNSGGLIEVVSNNFPGGTQEKRITGVTTEIRIEDIPNISAKRTKFHGTHKPRYNYNKLMQRNYHKIKTLTEITLYMK
jgi:hypothetical protein